MYLVGVDEAGRGSLAGPVAVGVVVLPQDFDWECIPGVGDSKKILPRKRALVCQRAEVLRAEGALDFYVSFQSASVIDDIGIVAAVSRAQHEAFAALSLHPEQCLVKLDGLLRAPNEYQQETIIGGDAKEPVIGLASIVAKVYRDRYMEKIAKQKKYQPYNFAKHKGYGTRAHRAAIVQYGLSTLHRRSYCQNILPMVKM
jgi:ribonuclease HII